MTRNHKTDIAGFGKEARDIIAAARAEDNSKIKKFCKVHDLPTAEQVDWSTWGNLGVPGDLPTGKESLPVARPIVLSLPYPPSINHYYGRRRDGNLFVGTKGKAYRAAVWVICMQRGIRPMTGRVKIRMDVHPPDRIRRDLDNIEKCLLDALTHGGAWGDDSQVKDKHSVMFDQNPTKPGHVGVMIEQIGVRP